VRHRRTAQPAGRWTAAASVLALVLSAVLLVSALRVREAQPADAGGAFVQSRREGGGAFVQSRREGVAHWRAVLAGLDRRRAEAYADADPRPLRRVYVPDSPLLRADRALLRRYHRQGLRVVDMRMRLFDVRVQERRRDHVVLVVRERLGRAAVRGHGTRRRLPLDDVDDHVLTLRHVAGRGWRIASARSA
jgi:hypothetical protein